MARRRRQWNYTLLLTHAYQMSSLKRASYTKAETTYRVRTAVGKLSIHTNEKQRVHTCTHPLLSSSSWVDISSTDSCRDRVKKKTGKTRRLGKRLQISVFLLSILKGPGVTQNKSMYFRWHPNTTTQAQGNKLQDHSHVFLSLPVVFLLLIRRVTILSQENLCWPLSILIIYVVLTKWKHLAKHTVT